MVSRFAAAARTNVIRNPDAVDRQTPRGVIARARAAAEPQRETHPPDVSARQAGNTDTADTARFSLPMRNDNWADVTLQA